MSWAAIAVGVVSLGVGVYQKNQANKKTKAALSQRKAYTTPDEVYKMLNALENKSPGDTATRDYQTDQIDKSFAQQLEVQQLLGADPNDSSALFQQKMQGILQVGQQFHASNMEAFGKYLGGLDMVASNKAGEWKSQQDIVKDSLQAAAADSSAANATINSGINTALSGYSASQSNQLYKDYLKTLNTGGGAPTATVAATAAPNAGFNDSTITGAIQPAVAAPQAAVATQTTVQPANNNSYLNDAAFLQWLQNNGIGTKK